MINYIDEINDILVKKFNELTKILRSESSDYYVNLFKDKNSDMAKRWMSIYKNVDFATISIELRNEPSGKLYYAPLLIYSDDQQLIREYLLVDLYS